MAFSWRRKRNRFYRRPDGTFVIESRLPLWQAAGVVVVWLLLIWSQGMLVRLPFSISAAWVAGAAVLAMWAGAFSRLEIGPAQAGGWFGRTRRLPLRAVVLRSIGLVDGVRISWSAANQGLHFEFASPFESEKEFLCITCRGEEVSHWFDHEFAWARLQQVAAQLRKETAGHGPPKN